MGALIMKDDNKEKQPFVASCVDAAGARDACGVLFDDLRGVNDYLEQGRQFLGNGSETEAFKNAVVSSIVDLDKISNRLRRSEEKTTQATSEPVL